MSPAHANTANNNTTATTPAATRALRLLLLGEATGLLAASTSQLLLAWWISQHGGPADLARYALTLALAGLLLTPLLSPLGDRCARHRLVAAARTVLVLDSLGVLLLVAAGHHQPLWLTVLGLVGVAAHAVLLPAEASLLPDRVAAAQLPQAVRWRRAAQALGGLLGPALAGPVLVVAGPPALAAISLLLAVLAACAAAGLGPSPRPVSTPPAAPAASSADATAAETAAATARGWWADLAAGLRAKWGVPLDRGWTAVGALMMLFLLPATGVLLPVRVQGLGLSAAWFGACGAALSAGVLLGVAGLAPALIRRAGRVRALALALGLCTLALAGLGLVVWPPGLVLCMAGVGLAMSVTQLVGQTHRLLAMPEDFRARMTAAHLTVAQLSATLAPALAAVLLQLPLAVSTVYLVLATGFATSGLLLLAVPGLGPFLRLDHEAVRDWYRRQHPQAFALPPPRP